MHVVKVGEFQKFTGAHFVKNNKKLDLKLKCYKIRVNTVYNVLSLVRVVKMLLYIPIER